MSSTSTRGSSVNEELHCRHLEEETESYNALVNDGGRPSHPISLGYDAANNLEEYREILSFWNPTSSNPYGWMVFGPQLHRWKQFRESQRRVRTDGPSEAGRFAAYCWGLQRRLARYRFERSFHLNEDPDRQDKLATWIEFLSFGYMRHEKHTDIMERLQQQYDEAWKMLVVSDVLKPLETDESFEYPKLLQLKYERNRAREVVDSAAAIVQSAESVSLQATDLSGRCLSRTEHKLSVARSKLVAATKLLEQTSRRYGLICDWMFKTKPYRIAKDNAAHESKLLRWILQQVPLIELELKPVKGTGNDPTEGKSRCQRNLKRQRADDRSDIPISKRQRQDREDHTPLEREVRVSAVQVTTQQPRQTCSSHTNPITLSSKPCSQRALRASRPLNPQLESAKSGVVLDNSARVSKRKRRNNFCLNRAPDSTVLRRSSRPRRPPERLQ